MSQPSRAHACGVLYVRMSHVAHGGGGGGRGGGGEKEEVRVDVEAVVSGNVMCHSCVVHVLRHMTMSHICIYVDVEANVSGHSATHDNVMCRSCVVHVSAACCMYE